MLTKTQIKIMEVFVSRINEKFSIKQVSELIKKPYPLIHRSIKSLIEQRFITRDNKELLSLNYKDNHAELGYIESIRKKDFLDKNRTISIFAKDIIDGLRDYFFIFLIFGSSIKKKEPLDIDLLIIVESDSKINEIEKYLFNIASHFTKKFDINVISIKSAYEMIYKRDDINVLNETLNNHIILSDAENYYRILKNAR